MLRLERHRQGPRVYVLGRRVHEWQLGLAALAVAAPVGIWRAAAGAACAAFGSWLVVKDWRDIHPRKRDSSAWRLGIHRAASSLRAARRSDGLPLLVLLGALDLLKGLDFEEALLSWAGAAFLWWGRDAFCVRHDRLTLRSSLWQLVGVAVAASAGVATAVWLSAPARPGGEAVVRE